MSGQQNSARTYPVVSVLGDGQLARMLQTPAVELGMELHLLASAKDASAAQVFTTVYPGDYTVWEDVDRACQDADVVTFDHEHVPAEFSRRLVERGIQVEPRPEALQYAQNKATQRTKMAELGFPVPDFAVLETAGDVEKFWERTGGTVCLKTATGGYDGHGVWFPETVAEATELVASATADGHTMLGEAKVPFERELSILVARRRSGEVRAWPVAQSVQKNGICVEAIAPAPGMSAERSAELEEMGTRIAELLEVTGVLAVEVFELADGSVLINELAMRPHNTGHWTQDGSETSQFEQHLRAVCDLPLGSTEMLRPGATTVMHNTLGAEQPAGVPLSERVRTVMDEHPDAKVHLYGKDYRAGRKLGHVNIVGALDEPADAVRERAAHAARILTHGPAN